MVFQQPFLRVITILSMFLNCFLPILLYEADVQNFVENGGGIFKMDCSQNQAHLKSLILYPDSG